MAVRNRPRGFPDPSDRTRARRVATGPDGRCSDRPLARGGVRLPGPARSAHCLEEGYCEAGTTSRTTEVFPEPVAPWLPTMSTTTTTFETPPLDRMHPRTLPVPPGQALPDSSGLAEGARDLTSHAPPIPVSTQEASVRQWSLVAVWIAAGLQDWFQELSHLPSHPRCRSPA